MTPTLALGAIVAAAAWLGLALTLPIVPKRRRADCFWLAVVVAVPLLGWLTYAWGPGAGLLGFAAGLLALCRCRRAVDSRTPLPPAE